MSASTQKQEETFSEGARSTALEEVGRSSQETAESDGAEGVTAAEARPLPLDQLFDLLKNSRRRLVLTYLSEHEQPVSTSDLAEFVAAHETDKTVEQITSNERKRAYVGLYQCHLPKMDGMDVVEFNKPRGIVRLKENAAGVYPYLTAGKATGARDGTRWAVRYLSFSALASVLLLALVWFGNSTVSAVGLGGIVLAFGVCSALYYRAWAASDALDSTGT